jgi:COP9 signalosome complex subunit 1
MPEENDNEGGLEEGAEEQSYFVDNPSLDLEATSNAYEGLAKLYRLQFIAEHCPCYRVEALKLAITAVQSTYNTTLYQRLHRKLQECIGGTANAGAAGLPDVAVGAADQGLGEKTVPALDLNWVDTRNKKSQMKLEKLDNDLKNYKSNSIKVCIVFVSSI